MRSRTRRIKPEKVAHEYVKAQKDRTGFYVKDVPPKGRGVFADIEFFKDDFLLQYCGKVCSWEEGDKLEREHSSGFRFFFKFKGEGYCIDATEEPVSGPSCGRLVNHGEKDQVNVKLSVIDVECTPSLCLFALRDINPGEELLYDYGVDNLPWKNKTSEETGKEEEGTPAEETGKEVEGTPVQSPEPSEETGKEVEGTPVQSPKASEETGKEVEGTPVQSSKPSEETGKDVEGTPVQSPEASEEPGKEEEGTPVKSPEASEEPGKEVEGMPVKSPEASEEPGKEVEGTPVKSPEPSEETGKEVEGTPVQSPEASEETGKEGTPVQSSKASEEPGKEEEGTPAEPSEETGKEVEGTPVKSPEKLQRWAHHVKQLLNCDEAIPVKKVGRLSFSRHFKITDGSNGTQIFVGVIDGLWPVAVKRMNQGMESMETQIHNIFGEEKLDTQFLLVPTLIEEDDDFIYIASPLCEYNLEEVIEVKSNPLRNELTPLKRASMCHQLMLGLSELHKANILHRDLKPRNVLLDHSCKVLLGDFGISRQTTGTTLVTKAMGTLCWTNPENNRRGVAYKKSSDIQMLGCLMYYILSDGHVPHETTHPYSEQPEGIILNMKTGHYSLKYLGAHRRFQSLLELMLNPQEKMRPTIEQCVSLYEDTLEPGGLSCDSDKTYPNDHSLDLMDVDFLKAFSFVASGISNSKKAKIQQLADMHGCTFSKKMQSSTTHIIMGTKNGICPRTMKYLMGVAAGLWIVSYKWVESSLDAGMLVPETNFEVEGDESWGCHSGPFRARTWKMSKPLLSDYSVVLFGKSSILSEDEVTYLLKMCGANSPKAVTFLTLLMEDKCPHDMKKVSIAGGKIWRHSNGSPPLVSFNWLLDTVATYDVQPWKNYLCSHPDSLSSAEDGAQPSSLANLDNWKEDNENDDLNSGSSEAEGDEDYIPEKDLDDKSDSSSDGHNSSSEGQLGEDKGASIIEDGAQPSSLATHDNWKEDNENDDLNSGSNEAEGDEDYIPEKDLDDKSNCSSDGHNSSSEDQLGEDKGASITESREESLNSRNKPFVVDSGLGKYCYCPYCDKAQKKLPRHCKKKHSDEMLVTKVSSIPPDNHQLIRQEWLQLRNMGNHKHNTLVYQGEADDLVVRRRPSDGHNERHSVYMYVPCADCLGYYHKGTLWIHKKSCKEGKQSSQPSSCSNHVKEGRMLIPLKDQVSRELNDCVYSMAMDKLSLTIRNDRDILQVGQNTLSVSNSSRKKDKAREKMRIIGKVLHLAREQDVKIKAARNLVHPSTFDVVVKCAKLLSGFDEDKQKHTAYSSVLRVRYALSDLASVVKNEYIKLQIKDKVAEVDDFMYLMKTEWRPALSASAQRQGQENQWKSPKLLPLTEDCVSFNNFLKGEEMKLKKAAAEGFMCLEIYKKFAAVTLAQVIFFNRRRPKEVEQLTVQDYLDQLSKKATVHDEILKSLTTPEKISLDRLTMLMVRGKRGRGVPILLTEDMKKSLDMLAEHNKEREFLFSRVNEGSATPLRGYEVMAELANEAVPSLKEPANIRCTKLRKHLATLSQLLNLNDNELEQLANHLGHDVSTHRDYYRLPMETLILAKVSKLLTLSQHGKVHEYQGKSLAEIVVLPSEQLAASCVNDDDDDEEEEEGEGGNSIDGYCGNEGNQNEEVGAENIMTSEKEGISPGEVCKMKNGEVAPRGSPAPEPADDVDVSEETEFLARKRRIKYTRWSRAEEMYLFRQKEIKSLLATRRAPRKLQCELIIQRSNGLLNGKTWMDVKNKVHNTNTASKLKLKRVK